jgi:hypothetical protein
MKARDVETMVASLTVLALLFAGCVGQQRAGAARTNGASSDSVKILSISPATDTALSTGDKVPFRVEVEYTLQTAQSGTITLVIQEGEQGREPLANETHVIQKGSGRLALVKEIQVPDTNAIKVFTPVSAQGATSTTVVDTRAYGVVRR